MFLPDNTIVLSVKVGSTNNINTCQEKQAELLLLNEVLMVGTGLPVQSKQNLGLLVEV
jgi:hypothetical protein